MIDDTPLSNVQLLTLLKNSPTLDAICAPLPEALQQRLLELQQRAGDAYAAGEWTTQNGQKITVPERGSTLTQAEAQAALGEAYLALEDKKIQLKTLMDAMNLTPSSRRQGWMGQMVENVKGWFR